MAKKSNGTKALVVGTMLGLVAGAAYALWKTPMSGKELRSKLSAAATDATGGVTAAGAGLGDKVMHVVETKLAPIVGVELGKTANGTQSVETAASETGPITVAEPAPAASNGHAEPAAEYGTSSIRAQRFAWGSPAPEATTAAVVTAAAVAAAPAVEPAKPAEPAPVVPAASADYGTASIRSKRFAWGSPAPEAAVAPQTPEAAPVEPVAKVEAPDVPAAEAATYGTTSIRAQRNTWGSSATAVAEPIANVTVAEPVVAKVEETVELPVVAASNGMHPFPKLGGLE